MKKLKKLLIASILLLTQAAQAQVSASVATHKQVFSQSLKSGDFATAIIAANYIVSAEKGGTYRDSLAILYYNSGQLNASYYWSTEVLKSKSKDPNMLEVKALCLKKSNNPLKAIDAYSELLSVKQDNAVYAYELMDLQYGVKRLLECAALGQQTLQKIKIDEKLAVSYSMDGKTSKQTPLKSAMYNLYGLALLELQKLPEAQKAFEEALQIDKDNMMAQANLEKTKKGVEPASK